MNSIAKVSLITLLLGVGATAAAAQTYAPEPAGARAMSSDVILVDNKKWKKKHKHHEKWVYNEKYGHRYRHKRPGYLYFYDGYWYPRPYWNEPGISIRLGL